ncbi:GNAT family N-acetyltransferase [Alloalcanivorax mobilis]|uniref:GNAT family N-acetyltransferase n=1 Tax=Alloalcanivorax mobilis TaxID=2019569 RepID=UPI000C7704EC|nr:GNAT family N-acetyltransferase [Alloalcanivorax mobilis]
MSTVEIRPVSGIAVEPWLDELADLRIRVFRDFPYLYDGSMAYERDYLDRYARSQRSVFVLAMEYNRLVGAATALPLRDADPEFLAPFQEHGPDPDQVFYFGESVLLPEYRGQGVGHRFFDLRELYAQDFGLPITTFCAVKRDLAHPRRPGQYQSLEPFWERRGYRCDERLVARFAWKDVGEAQATEKALPFWVRDARVAVNDT